MKLPIVFILTSTALLSACASVEGTYLPDCAAYEGDSISLEDGRFTWDRFTDAIPVDEAGNPVDPMPDYPVQGSYDIQGETLSLQTDSGESLDSLHVRRQSGRQYLLTTDQVEQLKNTGEVAGCSLVLGGYDDSR